MKFFKDLLVAMCLTYPLLATALSPGPTFVRIDKNDAVMPGLFT